MTVLLVIPILLLSHTLRINTPPPRSQPHTSKKVYLQGYSSSCPVALRFLPMHFLQDKELVESSCYVFMGFPGGSVGKKSTCNAGDLSLISRLGRSPKEENGNPFWCPCLENPMDKGTW